MIRLLLMVCVLSLGCARVQSFSMVARPCQDDAVKIVWHDVYGRTDAPPAVWWAPDSALTCTGKSGARGFPGDNGQCLGGRALANNVDLVWYGTYEDSPLAHELEHVAQAREGVYDYAHETQPFGNGGLVEQANARLSEAHLCEPPRPSAMALR